jgi:nitrile hydratase
MNGVHDMGGMHGMGPVEREADEPVFHADWERKVFALALATGYLGKWNIDMSRFARESMPAAAYLAATYYEKWLFGLQRLLLESGLVRADELAGRMRGDRAAVAMPADAARTLKAADVERVLRSTPHSRTERGAPPRFKVGDHVSTRNIHPTGHTRLPRYARGKHGIVHLDHGTWAFPDTRAAGLGPKPQHCYSVRFTARELWGPNASPRDAVYLDLFDDYLDPA